MDFELWKDKINNFKVVDVRGISGNFFPGLKKRAMDIKENDGITIIQSFDPIPLYEVMEDLGFSYYTEKISDTEYHSHFFREKQKKPEKNISMRPVALTNFPIIDEKLGDIAVTFWDLTWNDEKRFLSYETRLLLSLANALGAGRFRQASRELLKAYINGCDSRAFDDIFELVIWNQGIGNFSSEIGTSELFRAYKMIKKMEKDGVNREEICSALKEKFGDSNPDVKVI